MENRWHDDQDNNMRPDIKALPCPWCGCDHGIVVDTKLHQHIEYGDSWDACASCHECGASAPDINVTVWPDHPLYEKFTELDTSNERDVVNFAVEVWNCRK